MKVLGIDIGGSGVKGAVADTKTGEFVTERSRVATPQPATPDAVAEAVAEVGRLQRAQHRWKGTAACAFPGVVKDGVIFTAANLMDSWVGLDGAALFSDALGAPVVLVNDADAAGIAEAQFGAVRKRHTTALVLTLGTGIGSALLVNRQLVPNTELGHVPLRGDAAEHYASAAARQRDGLGWEQWADRLSEYLQLLERFLWPDVFVLGGGVSRKSDKWIHYLRCRTEVRPAKLRNAAGIVGAALAAQRSGG